MLEDTSGGGLPGGHHALHGPCRVHLLHPTERAVAFDGLEEFGGEGHVDAGGVGPEFAGDAQGRAQMSSAPIMTIQQCTNSQCSACRKNYACLGEVRVPVLKPPVKNS